MKKTNFDIEIENKERFEFGKNWKNFLTTLNETKIKQAENSLKEMLSLDTLEGKTFIDVGSGSGLFSLAARNLGARVTSFDYDTSSVWCTKKLQSIYYENDNQWKILQGSILDNEFLFTLGKFDYVYSWGVLHHTGDMWNALKNTTKLVNEKGKLFIAIYNYQQFISKYWKFVKKSYVNFSFMRPIWICIHIIYPTIPVAILKLISGKKYPRGMNIWNDLIDWLGGYPFEVAKPDEIFSFLKALEFNLEKLITVGGKLGCNEYVFKKNDS